MFMDALIPGASAVTGLMGGGKGQNAPRLGGMLSRLMGSGVPGGALLNPAAGLAGAFMGAGPDASAGDRLQRGFGVSPDLWHRLSKVGNILQNGRVQSMF